MSRLIDYMYIAVTIAFTVYGQLILKWRISQLAPMPENAAEKIRHVIFLLFDPLIFSGFAAAFLASLTWMAAISKLDLSHAYPFISLNFVVVIMLSGWLLNEPVSLQKALGVGLITFGTIIAARG